MVDTSAAMQAMTNRISNTETMATIQASIKGSSMAHHRAGVVLLESLEQ